MALETTADSATRELRKGIALRLCVAVAILIGLALAWQALRSNEAGVDAGIPAEGAQKSASAAGPVNAMSAAQPNLIEAKPAVEFVSKERSEPAALPTQAPHDAMTPAHSEGMIRTLEHAATIGQRTEEAGAGIAPAAESHPTAKAKLPSGPYLQVGVFVHPANAAELKAKLEAQGIPVFVATRVQVGPFKNKKDAEAMREKLNAMGLSSLLINQ